MTALGLQFCHPAPGGERMAVPTPAPDQHGQRSQLRDEHRDCHASRAQRRARNEQRRAHRTHQRRGQQGPHRRERVAGAAAQGQAGPRDEHEGHHQQQGARIADRGRQDVRRRAERLHQPRRRPRTGHRDCKSDAKRRHEGRRTHPPNLRRVTRAPCLSRKDGRAGAQPDDQRQQQEEHGKERRGRRDAVHA